MNEQKINEIKESVNRAFEGLVLVSKKLDFEAYIEYFDRENFTGLNADGTVVHSIEEFENTYRPHFSAIKSYQSLEFENVKITVINETTAILVNEFKARVEIESGDIVSASGGGTQVWSEINGDWKLVSVSSSAPS